jgi:hypothetical protein
MTIGEKTTAFSKAYYLLFDPVKWYRVNPGQLLTEVKGHAFEACSWEP